MRNQNEQTEDIPNKINSYSSKAKDLIRKNSYILISAITTTCLIIWRERYRKHASCLPPKVYCQRTWRNDAICSLLSKCIYRRGIRAIINSMNPMLASPRSNHSYITFREVLTMPSDGERISLDWAIPKDGMYDATKIQHPSEPNSIPCPVVIVIPALGTDSDAGYILDATSTFVRTGYVSVAMNYRGFDGLQPLSPRIVNPLNTSALRVVVTTISARMQPGQPLFLVGYRSGGYLISKYLGEECRFGTLMKHIRGGIGISAPMKLQLPQVFSSSKEQSPAEQSVLEESFQDTLIRQEVEYSQRQSKYYQDAFQKGIDPKSTIKDVYEHMSPFLSRNNLDDLDYPTTTTIGYKDVDHLLQEGCAFHFIPHITIPFLFIISKNDPTMHYNNCDLYYSTASSNPSVFVIETELVGYLGCNYAARPDYFSTSNFANDTAAAFMEANVALREHLWISNHISLRENKNPLRSKL